MKPALALVLLLLLPCIALASGDTVACKEKYTILKLAVGPQPQGYWPPTILSAMERRSGQYGFQLQAGFVVPRHYAVRDTLDNLLLTGHDQWFTIRGEIRKYEQRREHWLVPGKREKYIGIELFGNFSRVSRFDEYYLPGPATDTMPYMDALVLTKRMVGIGLVFGYQRYFGEWFMIGLHTGVGVKFKYTTAQYNRYDDAKSTYIHAMFMHVADKVGCSVGMAMPISVCIGYTLH